jgi:hypothetical protein
MVRAQNGEDFHIFTVCRVKGFFAYALGANRHRERTLCPARNTCLNAMPDMKKSSHAHTQRFVK